jgi:hypothetical protein
MTGSALAGAAASAKVTPNIEAAIVTALAAVTAARTVQTIVMPQLSDCVG